MKNIKHDGQARRIIRNSAIFAALLGCLTGTSIQALAQGANYPTKNVRIIVPYPAGGGADFIARITAQKFAEAMSQQFIVENRSGASGNIAAEAVAKAAPDGYMLLSSSSTTITAAAIAKVPFDVVKDFSHISTIASSCLLIATHPSVPAKTVKELVGIARSKPGSISYASSGVGTSPHLLGELLRQAAGVNFLHVPYKGGAPSMTALLSGEIAFAMPNLAAAIPLAKAGRLRVLAITCPRRSPLMPDIPTIAEAGYPAVEFMIWWGLSAPANTPRNIISRLNQEIVKITQLPEVGQSFSEQGVDPQSANVDEFNNFVRSELARWQKVIKLSGISSS